MPAFEQVIMCDRHRESGIGSVRTIPELCGGQWGTPRGAYAKKANCSSCHFGTEIVLAYLCSPTRREERLNKARPARPPLGVQPRAWATLARLMLRPRMLRHGSMLGSLMMLLAGTHGRRRLARLPAPMRRAACANDWVAAHCATRGVAAAACDRDGSEQAAAGHGPKHDVKTHTARNRSVGTVSSGSCGRLQPSSSLRRQRRL
jgi:hypothetical protein